MKLCINGQCVDGVLGELTLSKTRSEAAATLTAVLLTEAADAYFPQLTLALGDGVTLGDGEQCLFTGGVQELERDPRRVTVTAYDRGIYLTRNELYGVFAGTGAAIAAQVAAKLGIALGDVDAPGRYQTIVTAAGDTAFDILSMAAGEDREIWMDGETLCVGRRDAAPVALPSDHILECRSTGSIRRMVNRAVVLKRGTSVPLAAAQDSGQISTYGQFQTVQTLSGSSAREQAEAALSGVRHGAEVTALGDLALRCGGRVSLSLPQCGLEGTYAVTGVRHRWKRGLFLSELTLEPD